jgi:DNA-binding Xre family transcriptional regulator
MKPKAKATGYLATKLATKKPAVKKMVINMAEPRHLWKIREVMKYKGISHNDLARRLGWPKSTVTGRLNRLLIIRLDHLKALCAALEIVLVLKIETHITEIDNDPIYDAASLVKPKARTGQTLR